MKIWNLSEFLWKNKPNKWKKKSKPTKQNKIKKPNPNQFCLQAENYHPNFKNLTEINLVIKVLVLLKLNNQMKQ